MFLSLSFCSNKPNTILNTAQLIESYEEITEGTDSHAQPLTHNSVDEPHECQQVLRVASGQEAKSTPSKSMIAMPRSTSSITKTQKTKQTLKTK